MIKDEEESSSFFCFKGQGNRAKVVSGLLATAGIRLPLLRGPGGIFIRPRDLHRHSSPHRLIAVIRPRAHCVHPGLTYVGLSALLDLGFFGLGVCGSQNVLRLSHAGFIYGSSYVTLSFIASSPHRLIASSSHRLIVSSSFIVIVDNLLTTFCSKMSVVLRTFL